MAIIVYGFNDSPEPMARRYDPRFWKQFEKQVAEVAVDHNMDLDYNLTYNMWYDALMQLFIEVSRNN